MEREFSAGGTVVRFDRGQWWMVVIEPQSSPEKRAKQRQPVMALPKGLVDPGESPQQTAVREVREETGVEAELIAKLTDTRYVYLRTWGDGKQVFKVVSFYLLRYRAREVDDISPEMRIEVRRAKWIPLEEAVRLLTHHGEREVARLAAAYVAGHPELAIPGTQAFPETT